jgi:GH25 family lysozyme M1 (1,4-beta-N-acetylmuramidase)
VDLNDGYVTALYEKGLISGVQEGEELRFLPNGSMTRAEISAVVWQVQEYATHIVFRGEYLDILDSIPVNPYNKAAFVTENGRMRYSDDQVESVLGIDVSSHQQEIDWQAVAADGIQFAMIRVAYRGSTIGNLIEDTCARANLEGALNAGLEVGVYVFSQAVSEEEAREEARLALEIVKNYDITGPVVFDWENMSYEARTDGLSANLLTAAANAFCETVAQAGYQPMVYFNLHIGYLLYHLDGIAQYPFWLAEYNPAPTFYYTFQMLQYSSSGQVNGINGRTDMNIWLRPKTEQSEQTAQTEQTEPTEQPTQTEQTEQTVEIEQAGQEDDAAQTEQSTEPAQTEQAD